MSLQTKSRTSFLFPECMLHVLPALTINLDCELQIQHEYHQDTKITCYWNPSRLRETVFRYSQVQITLALQRFLCFFLQRSASPSIDLSSERKLAHSKSPQNKNKHESWRKRKQTNVTLPNRFALRFALVNLVHCSFLNSGALKLYRPRDRRLSAKLVPSLADRGCRVVSATNSHGC
jgi:hypothetical protein